MIPLVQHSTFFFSIFICLLLHTYGRRHLFDEYNNGYVEQFRAIEFITNTHIVQRFRCAANDEKKRFSPNNVPRARHDKQMKTKSIPCTARIRERTSTVVLTRTQQKSIASLGGYVIGSIKTKAWISANRFSLLCIKL